MHHAAAHHFEPSGVAANSAAFSTAAHTPHINLSRRLGKGKIRRPKTHGKVRFKISLEKFDYRAF